jgi:hypothetical protein
MALYLLLNSVPFDKVLILFLSLPYTATHVQAKCAFSNGTLSNEFQCGPLPQCCPDGSTCLSNGICQDRNNLDNGTVLPGRYNFTGLYMSGSCSKAEACLTHCSGFYGKRYYALWAIQG